MRPYRCPLPSGSVSCRRAVEEQLAAAQLILPCVTTTGPVRSTVPRPDDLRAIADGLAIGSSLMITIAFERRSFFRVDSALRLVAFWPPACVSVTAVLAITFLTLPLPHPPAAGRWRQVLQPLWAFSPCRHPPRRCLRRSLPSRRGSVASPCTALTLPESSAVFVTSVDVQARRVDRDRVTGIAEAKTAFAQAGRRPLRPGPPRVPSIPADVLHEGVRFLLLGGTVTWSA